MSELRGRVHVHVVWNEAGMEKRIAELSRHDLLDMCLERGLGHPQWDRMQLQASLQAYRKQAEDFETSLRSLRPSPGTLNPPPASPPPGFRATVRRGG